jgi:hypothetical protein
MEERKLVKKHRSLLLSENHIFCKIVPQHCGGEEGCIIMWCCLYSLIGFFSCCSLQLV